ASAVGLGADERTRLGPALMQHARAAVIELESRDLHLEPFAVLSDAEVASLHAAGGGAQPAAAGVLERLARLEQRLLANDAQALDLFDLAQRVGDDPVARNQLGRHLAGIRY